MPGEAVYEPRAVRYELRAAVEVLAETVATRIAALESFARAEADLSVRRIEKRIIEAIAREGDWKSALFDNPQVLLQPLRASGAAVSVEGQILSTGEVPGTQQIRAMVQWLDRQAVDQLFATAELGAEAAEVGELVVDPRRVVADLEAFGLGEGEAAAEGGAGGGGPGPAGPRRQRRGHGAQAVEDFPQRRGRRRAELLGQGRPRQAVDRRCRRRRPQHRRAVVLALGRQ